jgi:hypothetical protein
MAMHTMGHPNMIIASGSSVSNTIKDFDDAYGLTVYSPGTLTDTITVEVEPSSSGTSFVTLQSGGIDVTLPALKATVLNPVPFKQMRVRSCSLEGQSDTFRVNKVILV